MKALYGDSFPLMSLNERVLNLLALELIDDVIFDAPFVINQSMINHLNIDEG